MIDIPKPPRDFWPQLVKFDKQLHDIAAKQKGGWFRHMASEWWGWVDDQVEAANDDPRRAVYWEGGRFLGGRRIGAKLIVTQAAEIDQPMQEVTPFPALEKTFAYQVYARRPELSVLLVMQTGYLDLTPGNSTEMPPVDVRKIGREAVKCGLWIPTEEDYRQLLDELERGASGECSFRDIMPEGLL